MRIKKVEPLPNIFKFRNKEDFTNRIIQEVILICKDKPDFLSTNKKILKLKKVEEELLNKDEKFNLLLEKSKNLKNDLTNKIKTLSDDNNNFKNKLLQIIESNK